jgi:hypothetical protein
MLVHFSAKNLILKILSKLAGGGGGLCFELDLMLAGKMHLVVRPYNLRWAQGVSGVSSEIIWAQEDLRVIVSSKLWILFFSFSHNTH